MNDGKVEHIPDSVCFMVMPFGVKEVGHLKGAPEKVDFDRLWEKAFQPAILELGYRAVRADQDYGSVIVNNLFERLAVADLLIADVSIPNANVCYELGIRHAAASTGTVLIAADWAIPPFDLYQITRIKYPLSQERVSTRNAATIVKTLKESIKKASKEKSPFFRIFPNFPKVDQAKLDTFKDTVNQMVQFQTEIKTIRRLKGDAQTLRRDKLIDQFFAREPIIPSIALDLLSLTRDSSNWQSLLDLIRRLPQDLRNCEEVREQMALANAKLHRHDDAIANLESLIDQFGPSGERLGLLGGRFKELYNKNKDLDDLDRAIEHYEAGMHMDLNAYYPGCNLPRLLRERDEEGDQDRATAICHLVKEACQISLEHGGRDPWLNSTLLGVAFDFGDVEQANKLLRQVRKDGVAKWMHDSTMVDLKRSMEQHPDPEIRLQLEVIYKKLGSLVK